MRHANCQIQVQQTPPEAQRDFAQRNETIQQLQHQQELHRIVEPDPPSRRMARSDWIRIMLDNFRDFARYAELGDSSGIASAAGNIIRNSPRTRKEWSQPTRNDQDDELYNIRRSIRILQTSGRKGQAMDALRAGKMYTVTPEREPIIKGLYVPRTVDLEFPDDVWTNDQYNFKVDSTVVETVLKQKHPHTGKGPSNIGYGDLATLLDEDPLFLKHLTIFLESLLNGKIPKDSQAMFDLKAARGVPIEKSNGKPQPIGVRECLTNLAYAVQSKQATDAIKQELCEDDYGFKVRNGTAIPVIRVQSHIDEARKEGLQLVVIELDIRNAYGTTQRNGILKLLLEKFPDLVRGFLVTHQTPSTIKFPNMDAFEIDEGIIQGDPMAPAYAQLMYSLCCRTVRDEFPEMRLLASFFDDTFIVDGFDDAIKAAIDLKNEFKQKAGCDIELSKSSIYSTLPLSEQQKRQCEELGLHMKSDGLRILGSPVGNHEFITQFLEEKVDEIQIQLDRISKAEALGSFNNSMCTVQGLYHMLRDCANQLGKHLLRTVHPNFTVPAFARLDSFTKELTGRLFDITNVSTTLENRFTLPGSLGGLGMTTYEEAALPAFLGCVYSIGPTIVNRLEGEPTKAITGLIEARDRMIAKLELEESSLVPNLEEFFHEAEDERKDEKKERAGLSRKLLRAVQENRRAKLLNRQGETGKFILQMTASDHASDFLFAPMTKKRCRMPRVFKIYGRFYLGEAVTSPICNIGNCRDQPVDTFGEHGWHMKSKVTARHNKVKQNLGVFLQRLHTSGKSDYSCQFETPLSDLGMRPKQGASNSSDARCDFVLKNSETQRMFVTDVMVTHPSPKVRGNTETPLAAVIEGYKRKMSRYCDNYAELNSSNFKPLVFDTYGGWHEETESFLKMIVESITSKEVEGQFEKLWSELRNRVAVAIATGQGELLLAMNAKQRSSVRWQKQSKQGGELLGSVQEVEAE